MPPCLWSLADCPARMRASMRQCSARSATDLSRKVEVERPVDGEVMVLNSVVCYFLSHYVVFSFSALHGEWVIFDDHSVRKVCLYPPPCVCSLSSWPSFRAPVLIPPSQVGAWEICVQFLVANRLQPSLLFYCSPISPEDPRLLNRKLVCACAPFPLLCSR